jgi:hypothetical protein
LLSSAAVAVSSSCRREERVCSRAIKENWWEVGKGWKEVKREANLPYISEGANPHPDSFLMFGNFSKKSWEQKCGMKSRCDVLGRCVLS